MRFTFAVLLVAACSVAEKNPTEDAGPGDTPGPVDPTAPDTTLTATPAEFSADDAAVFEFESNDPDATFQCSIDEDSPVPCSSPYRRTLGDGPHGIAVRAVNVSGNSDDTPAEHRWTIDTVAPDTTLTEKPPLADNSVMVLFDFESGEINVAYECALDGAAFTACLPDDMFGPLGEGPHSFSVRAKDRAGNTDTSPAVHAWAIDTTMPDTQILSAPGDISGSTTATFSFGSPDAGSGAAFECSLDGATFATCASPRTFDSLAEGMHSFGVRVRDSVGNLDPTPARRAWLVDLTAPNTAITSGPSGPVATASGTFVFTSNEDDVTFECALDAAAFAPCTSPHNVMMLAQVAHTFAVRAIDGANHPDPTPATANWTVDTASPDITVTTGPAADSTTGPYVTFAFSASEGVTECSLDAAAFAACPSPVSFNAAAGAHQFRVRAVDGAGNAGLATRSWTIACAAPAAAGAAGLLHLDDGAQSQPDAAGGAAALLGDDVTAEPTDPSAGPGRFGGGLVFDAAAMDHVSWPLALGASTAFTVELWSQASPTTGTHTVFVSGDDRITIRVQTTSATTVKYTIVVADAASVEAIATSADVTAGAWHHVVASLAEPTLRLWVDGVRTQTADVALGGGPLLDTARLGDGYTGSIDEVWVAQTAVTTDDDARGRFCPL